jgi:hypothetical protein
MTETPDRIANDQDLRAPLVLNYSTYVVYDPTTGNPGWRRQLLPCIHGVGGTGPICGSLTRVPTDRLEPIGLGLLTHLFNTEDRFHRRIWFCQNCIASDSHPNQYRYWLARQAVLT